MDLHVKLLARITGFLFILAALAMVLPTVVSVIYGEEKSTFSFLAVILPSLFVGILMVLFIKPSHNTLHMRDGFIMVAMSWILISAIAALPYVIHGCIPHYVDAFFEAASGFSTTGASILNDIESLPKSMLFWRSFAHWLGGMGILVFAVALLPALGISGQMIVRAETPGPTLSKVTPHTSDMARVLYLIYTGMTIAETLFLLLGGLSFYDAIVHTFATVGTGGFSTYNASIAAFQSPYVEGVITVFMIFSGVNFNLYFLALAGGLRHFWRDAEFRLYILITLLATLATTLYLTATQTYSSLLTSFRYSVFQVVSILTTTGFSTTDFALWPTFTLLILFGLFFVGGSSSSTGGGVKVVRVLVLLQLIKRNLALRIHPNALVTIKLDHKPLHSSTVQGISSFLFLYLLLVFITGLLVSLDGFDLMTSFSAAASCVGNIGPGFHDVGPAFNYSIFSAPVKWVLSFAMIAGRLELFTLLMLLSRRFWNPN